jgi:hypothetical protein
MVRIHLDPPPFLAASARTGSFARLRGGRAGWRLAAMGFGGLAQLGERLLCMQEVIGSIPLSSTNGARGALAGGPSKL